MEDYRSNSHKSKLGDSKNEKKKIDKVVRGNVKTKKKSEIKKFTDIFLSEDVDDVKSYIMFDVLIPAVKKAISDIVVNGIDMLLYGETGHTKKSSTGSKVSYRSYYERERDRHPSSRSSVRGGYDFYDITLDNRGEAEEVLARMDDLMDTYGIVSVADLYDLVGEPSNYTDNKYGWTDIRNASVVRTRDGYMLKLPKALPIN